MSNFQDELILLLSHVQKRLVDSKQAAHDAQEHAESRVSVPKLGDPDALLDAVNDLLSKLHKAEVS